MYLLKFLQDSQEQPTGVDVEYRLACSGEFYNPNVETFDWRKSDLTRVLLENPFQISVVSRPFDSYPQELCVRANIKMATEKGGSPQATFSRTFLPDSDVIDDLCAVITLLSRRLVTAVTKTREMHSSSPSSRLYDLAMPILPFSTTTIWPRRPATIITSLHGQEFKSNDPPSVAVDPEALAAFLAKLPKRTDAKEIIYAARLYKSALELIHERPDTAYLALISVVETFADIACKDFQPNDNEKLKSRSHILKTALQFGLNEEQAKALTLATTQGDRWLSRKFVKFCMDYCSPAELSNSDSLYISLAHLNPSQSETENALKRIYSTRSKNLHVAVPFPPGIAIGMSPQINIRDLPLDPLAQLEIPAAPWFERIVSIAVRNFLIADQAKPFIDV